jgi:WhiB family transcriptional regulator, redox-sensing transcriptional regulator
MITNPHWRLDATCRREDPELFFPVAATGSSADQADQARRICLACPVRAACLDWAMRHHQDYGIWGGTTAQERRVLRRVMARRQVWARR